MLLLLGGIVVTSQLVVHGTPHTGASSTPPRPNPAPGGPDVPGAAITPPPTGPTSTHLTSVHWVGTQVISGAVTYSNLSVSLTGGNVVVAPGGSLTLDNVTLQISQMNTSGLSALSHGVLVEAGGQLQGRYSAILSANGPAYPAFVVIAGASRTLHVAFTDLGGSGHSPVAGREGIHVSGPHVLFEDDVFDHTYEVLFAGAAAVGDAVASSVWLNSTITGGQVGWAEVDAGASWVNLTDDSWSGSADAGMLALICGPHTTVANSTFVGDPSGSQPYQVYLTYNGWTDGGIDASYASVVDDHFQTANLGISDGSHFRIDRDSFNDTGHWPSTGGQAAIIVVTWIGSGAGERTRDVEIEHDSISNFTHYAIRVSQNVSGFNVSSDRIFASQSTYSSAITEADGIYLIRGVNNGTVWNNSLDMTDLRQPSEPTNGVVLEAQVNDVNVSANRIYNCSEVGVTVQGDSGALPAPSYYLGPSSRDVIFENRIVNYHSVAQQSMYSAEAIETWMWANGTRIVDNTIGGWAQVNTTDYWNGAGILTSSSEQLFAGNTMTGVRFGFVFEKFDSQQELRSLGSFNRSYNLLSRNQLSQVTVVSLAENARDDMGPIVNLLSGPVDPSWSFWFSGSNATLRLVNAALPSYPASSPYRSSHVGLVGPVTLEKLHATYDFGLSEWSSSPRAVRYNAFQAQLGATTGWFNLTLLSYSASSGVVQWNGTQSARGSDTFTLGGASVGTVYSFTVDGTLATLLTALGHLLRLGWTGSGSHHFAIQKVTLVAAPEASLFAPGAPPWWAPSPPGYLVGPAVVLHPGPFAGELAPGVAMAWPRHAGPGAARPPVTAA